MVGSYLDIHPGTLIFLLTDDIEKSVRKKNGALLQFIQVFNIISLQNCRGSPTKILLNMIILLADPDFMVNKTWFFSLFCFIYLEALSFMRYVPFFFKPSTFFKIFTKPRIRKKSLCGECLKGKCCLDNLLLKSCSNLASNNLNIVIIKFHCQ